MSARLNEHRRNNTSSVPCIRLARRLTRTGLVRWFVDVTWHNGKRGGASYPAFPNPVKAVERAMTRRHQEVGAVYAATPRKAWEAMKKQAGKQ